MPSFARMPKPLYHKVQYLTLHHPLHPIHITNSPPQRVAHYLRERSAGDQQRVSGRAIGL